MREEKTDILISASDAEKLIGAHDGHVALVYLCAKACGCTDAEQLAARLYLTHAEVSAALEKLGRMGLASEPAQTQRAAQPEKHKLLPGNDELPQYTAEDIRLRTRDSGEFAAIVSEAETVMGHIINTNDMRTLFGIYDYYALPPEVIMQLLHYCGELCDEKYQGKRRPTMRFIEQEAKNWLDREIVSFELAEEYIRFSKQRRTQLGRVCELMDIRGRSMTAQEHKYITSWLELGFDEETIRIAYERTIDNIGRFSWKYADSIVRSWAQKGLHTPEEIEEKDGRHNTRPAASNEKRSIDINSLSSVLDKI